MALDRTRLQERLNALAAQGVRLGTSSWKYAGWRGQIYDETRYLWHGKLSEARFERDCLREYAEVFPTVCVDAAYYKFPDHRYLEGMVSAVPPEFRFSLKVTDEITVKRFSNLPRFGPRAGQANANFLNADLFIAEFLAPCAEFRASIGVLMFEFSRFYPADYARGREFVADLDAFLGRLPRDWDYGVELRNPAFLHPDYFATLARHGVTHIYNNWAGMPSVAEQRAMPGSLTNPALVAARFLLKPGRKYQEAVDLFSPYRETKEVNEEARAAGAALIRERIESGPAVPPKRAYIYVNNRLEGNSPLTIDAMVERSLGR